MKYGEYLRNNLTQEWKTKYLNYNEMNEMITTSIPDVDLYKLNQKSYYEDFRKSFFTYCENELIKVNDFYQKKSEEGNKIFTELCKDFEFKMSNEIPNITRNSTLTTYRGYFSELYLSLILLLQYQDLNFIGFRKILKKFDKRFHTINGLNWFEQNVKNAYFHTSTEAEDLIIIIEDFYTDTLMGGNRKMAMERLSVPPLHVFKNITILAFRFGLVFGTFITLLTILLISLYYYYNIGVYGICDLIFYRGPFLIIELVFFCGVNAFGWRLYGINHILIFQIDRRDHLTEYHIMEFASIFSIIWTISALCFIYSSRLNIPKYLPMILLYIIMIAFLFNPIKILYYKTRLWTLRYLWRIIIAPFHEVLFVDFWMAEQLLSLVTAFSDIQFFILHLNLIYKSFDVSQEIIAEKYCTNYLPISHLICQITPCWFRLAQCMRRYSDTRNTYPHLVNAGKYATTLLSNLSIYLYSMKRGQYSSVQENPWFFIMIFIRFTSSFYLLAWDIKFDWGLLNWTAVEHKWLREEIVYRSTYLYYISMIGNFIIRFEWIVGITLIHYGYIHFQVMLTISAILEVFRRFIWNFFRLENEHINNCGKFRAVQDIPVSSRRNTAMVQNTIPMRRQHAF